MLEPVVRLVDDDEGLLGGFSFVLKVAGFQVLTYTSAEDFLAKDDFARPGCIVLDVRMGGMNGLECQQALREKGVSQPILFMSGHGDIDMAMRAVKNGAADFLQKPVEADDLAEACRKLVNWHVEYLKTNGTKERDRAQCASLTDREREVAECVAQGLSNKAIADRFGITEQGVKFHRTNIYRKLGVHSAVEVEKKLATTQDTVPDSSDFLTLRVLQ